MVCEPINGRGWTVRRTWEHCLCAWGTVGRSGGQKPLSRGRACRGSPPGEECSPSAGGDPLGTAPGERRWGTGWADVPAPVASPFTTKAEGEGEGTGAARTRLQHKAARGARL